MKRYFLTVIVIFAVISAKAQTLNTRDFGLLPNHREQNASLVMKQICDSARYLCEHGHKVTIRMEKGRYYFHEKDSWTGNLYISNHDQANPKHVGIPMQGLRNVSFDGRGADLLFAGHMLPVMLTGSKYCTLKNFSVDFVTPHIAQATVLSNTTDGITYRMAPWDNWTIEDGVLWTNGEGWKYHSDYAIAFDGETRHLIPETSDLTVKTRGLTVIHDSTILAPGWKDDRLLPGTRLAIRTWDRPAPGLFLSDDVNTRLKNIKIHYAEGMGVLAQTCENIDLDNVSVCLRGQNAPRYFTTQADATHFSGCKGHIRERNSLYEGMMDDAINVHGTYLKIVKVENNNTVIGQYMHEQTYGFHWGDVGDSVQVIESNTMEKCGPPITIQSIEAIDHNINDGVKQFCITFNQSLPRGIGVTGASFGLENLTWTSSVEFSNNTIRNNRARGSLFSTPRKVVVRKNTFDHTSGCAILFCGDCNGWYETGACCDVTIEKNRFINALTNQFQFTNAIISIYPEIPNLKEQKQYFHSGIIIRKNTFETFDKPLLYAKSVDGLSFIDNKVIMNYDFKPIHWNTHRFWLQHVNNFKLEGTKVKGTIEDIEKDVLTEVCDSESLFHDS